MLYSSSYLAMGRRWVSGVCMQDFLIGMCCSRVYLASGGLGVISPAREENTRKIEPGLRATGVICLKSKEIKNSNRPFSGPFVKNVKFLEAMCNLYTFRTYN